MLSAALVASCGRSPSKCAQRVQSTVAEQTLPELLPPPPPDTVTIRFIGDVMLHTAQIEAARARGKRRLPSGQVVPGESTSGHTSGQAVPGESTSSLPSGPAVSGQSAEVFDFSPFLDSLAPDLRAADLAIAGMEFTMAGPPYTGYPQFSAPDSYATYLADCGIDVFLTANNHIWDRGLAGFRRTMRVCDSLEAAGRIRHTGCRSPWGLCPREEHPADQYPRNPLAGDALNSLGGDPHNPLIITVKDQRIAIVNFTYGTNVGTSDYVMRQARDTVRKLLAAARERGADFIVVCPHWGIEYDLRHSASQESWAQFLADEGADLIVGAHPHVVQDTAVVRAADGRLVPVYYSIGNAVSNMSAPNTQDELMVTARISQGKLTGLSHDRLRCTRPGQLTDSFATVIVK